jgi:hypothetical protein
MTDSQTSTVFGLGMRDILLVIGAALVLGLVLFLWAYLTHKTRRSHHNSNRLSKTITRATKPSGAPPGTKRGKIRKKRRDHPDLLPRNPTLGETGGLPPIRPEEPPAEAAPH